MSEEAHSAPVVAGPSKTPLILALVNTLVVMGALGMIVYTKVLFKRPAITESAERDRLNEFSKQPQHVLIPGQVSFEPTTVNILPSTVAAATEDATPTGKMKLHYATVGFALELSDSSRKDAIEELKPRIMDKMLSMLGRKTFAELTTVQGRYLLRSQIAEIVNDLATDEESASHTPLVTNVFFTQFIVQ